MNEKVFLAASLVVGLTVSGLLDAHDRECWAEGPRVGFADCKPMNRVEVKAEAEKLGDLTSGVGVCSNAAVAGKTIDLVECPG